MKTSISFKFYLSGAPFLFIALVLTVVPKGLVGYSLKAYLLYLGVWILVWGNECRKQNITKRFLISGTIFYLVSIPVQVLILVALASLYIGV